MRVRKLAIMATLIFCVISCTACHLQTEPELLYQSDNVKVSIMEETEEINYAYYEWAILSDEKTYTKNNAILTGEASNVRQAAVTYTFLGTEVTDQITIFDVKVDKVLVCRSGSFQKGDLVTVGTGYNMSNYGEGLPVIEEGASYLLFSYVTADRENDSMELKEYVDCWISAPKDLLLEKVGDYYLSTDFFSDAPDSHNLAEYLALDERQVASLASMSSMDEMEIQSYVDDILQVDSSSKNADALEALFVLKSRTMDNSQELWDLSNRSYLIDCDVLASHIQNTALFYDN